MVLLFLFVFSVSVLTLESFGSLSLLRLVFLILFLWRGVCFPNDGVTAGSLGPGARKHAHAACRAMTETTTSKIQANNKGKKTLLLEEGNTKVGFRLL